MPVVKNIKIVTKNLNEAIQQISTQGTKGLTVAGLQIRRDSQLKTPVDTGKLKASAFTDTSKKPTGALVTVGYTAEYAPHVHEMPGRLKGQPRPPRPGSKAGRGKYWDPQGKASPKFLERAVSENEDKILIIIKNYIGK